MREAVSPSDLDRPEKSPAASASCMRLPRAVTAVSFSFGSCLHNHRLPGQRNSASNPLDEGSPSRSSSIGSGASGRLYLGAFIAYPFSLVFPPLLALRTGGEMIYVKQFALGPQPFQTLFRLHQGQRHIFHTLTEYDVPVFRWRRVQRRAPACDCFRPYHSS